MECGAGSDRVMDVDADMCALDGSGRFYLFRCRLLSSVTVKRRKSWLLAASALASSSLGISGPALALDECGPVARQRYLHSAGNPYPTGINYGITAGYPLERHASSGVNVIIPAGSPALTPSTLANTGGVTAAPLPSRHCGWRNHHQ